MNVAYKGPWPAIAEHDALLMDVARRIQLTKTKHEVATRNFKALCDYVDREGSPLQGKVRECYPSGSFAIGTAIASRVKSNQHDVDVVMELNIPPEMSPQTVLDLLFEAINGEHGSRYHSKVKRNSRCVTVSYDDGTSVDLMAIARIAGPERAGHLFHHKLETGEGYHKRVNPWGFVDHFNRHVEEDRAFYEAFAGRRLLVEGALERADTQPMPDHAPIEEKSPRVVALQLVKRNRDINWRASARRGMRKPPSVVLGAVALEAGPVCASLVDEVIGVANAIRARLFDKSGPRGVVQVLNPAYTPDVFTDRWPENPVTQDMFDVDLRRLVVELHRLKNNDLLLEDKKALLERLFGETAASYAIESLLDSRRVEMEAGRMHMGPTGRAVTGAVAAPAIVTGPRTSAARPATREGGGYLEDY